MQNEDRSIDLIGLGKLAKSIPDDVYLQASETVTSTFEKLIAPITETTSGFGRYIKQKFDNMVDVEKSLLTYAINNAQIKIENQGRKITIPASPKSFIRAMEETSKEVDPLLNILWTNLLASQLSDDKCHPFFVDILSTLSSKEALLLARLKPFEHIGNISNNVLIRPHKIRKWATENKGELNDWDLSCSILCEFGLTNYLAPETHKPGDGNVLLYLTYVGKEFLDVVSG